MKPLASLLPAFPGGMKPPASRLLAFPRGRNRQPHCSLPFLQAAPARAFAQAARWSAAAGARLWLRGQERLCAAASRSCNLRLSVPAPKPSAPQRMSHTAHADTTCTSQTPTCGSTPSHRSSRPTCEDGIPTCAARPLGAFLPPARTRAVLRGGAPARILDLSQAVLR